MPRFWKREVGQWRRPLLSFTYCCKYSYDCPSIPLVPGWVMTGSQGFQESLVNTAPGWGSDGPPIQLLGIPSYPGILMPAGKGWSASDAHTCSRCSLSSLTIVSRIRRCSHLYAGSILLCSLPRAFRVSLFPPWLAIATFWCTGCFRCDVWTRQVEPYSLQSPCIRGAWGAGAPQLESRPRGARPWILVYIYIYIYIYIWDRQIGLRWHGAFTQAFPSDCYIYIYIYLRSPNRSEVSWGMRTWWNPLFFFSKEIKGFHMTIIIFLTNMYTNSQRLPHDSVLYLYKHLGSLPFLCPKQYFSILSHLIWSHTVLIRSVWSYKYFLTEKRHPLKTPGLW